MATCSACSGTPSRVAEPPAPAPGKSTAHSRLAGGVCTLCRTVVQCGINRCKLLAAKFEGNHFLVGVPSQNHMRTRWRQLRPLSTKVFDPSESFATCSKGFVPSLGSCGFSCFIEVRIYRILVLSHAIQALQGVAALAVTQA